MHRIILASVIFALSGCLPVSSRIASNFSDQQLCEMYAGRETLTTAGAQNLRDEIRARKLVRDHQWSNVDGHAVAPRMTTMEVVCSRGRPTDIRSLAFGSRKQDQWVYKQYLGRTIGSRFLFVYVENSEVVATQN